MIGGTMLEKLRSHATNRNAGGGGGVGYVEGGR